MMDRQSANDCGIDRGFVHWRMERMRSTRRCPTLTTNVQCDGLARNDVTLTSQLSLSIESRDET
jgi:hypothetical protein